MKRTDLKRLLIIAFLLAQTPAYADEFPGVGDKQAWEQACNICNQGSMLFQAGQVAEGFKHFEKALELYKHDPVLFYNCGVAHQTYAYACQNKMDELAKAEQYFQQASQFQTASPQVWIHMANVQAELGKFKDSLSSLQSVLKHPNLNSDDRQKTLQAMEFVKAKIGSDTSSGSGDSSGSDDSDDSDASAASQAGTAAGASSASQSSTASGGTGNDFKTEVPVSKWSKYGDDTAPFTLSYPSGWSIYSDQTTGRVDVTSGSGAQLSILPFFVGGQKVSTLNPEVFFNTLIKLVEPNATWTKAQVIGGNTLHSTYDNAKESATAALVLAQTDSGVVGRVAVARVQKNTPRVSADTFARIIASLKANPKAASQSSTSQSTAQVDAAETASSSSTESATSDSSESAPAGSPEQSDETAQTNDGEPEPLPVQPSMEQAPPQMTSSGLPMTQFSGYTTFRDPQEGAFTVEVPAGWKVEGGLTRASAIDARPWVRTVSPDGLITAFIGDGKIPPFTMPSAQGTMLGFGVGRRYNGTIVAPYMSARRYAEYYAKSNLKKYFSNIQVVEAHDHPDYARLRNGTVGVSKSEAASIKIKGNYGNIPAVGYYLACTKATVGYGAGMWWVSTIAGAICPADRDTAGLSVILHMLQTFTMDPQWVGQGVRTAGQVSRNYTAASQAAGQAIMNRYWSQQAANESIHSAYWNRQKSQDRAANNFSNYIRGVENVQDTSTGKTYQVDYGPRYHYIDPNSGNIAGTEYSAPSPEWRQLMSVP